MTSKRVENAYDPANSVEPKFIGHDLTEDALDALYDYYVLGQREPIQPEHSVIGWWEDKFHQVLHRLLSRLTRAEHPRRAPILKTPKSIREACVAWLAEDYSMANSHNTATLDELDGAERGFDAGASWAMSAMVDYIKSIDTSIGWGGTDVDDRDHPGDTLDRLVKELRREFKLDE